MDGRWSTTPRRGRPRRAVPLTPAPPARRYRNDDCRQRRRRWHALAWREQRSSRVLFRAVAGAAASANGLPSESRQMAHRSPGWMTEPPSSRTRSSVAGRSATVKYGSEAVSPGPGPRSWTPRRRPSASASQPGSGGGGPGRELDPEDALPEAQRAIGVVGRELDQRRGHEPQVWPAVRARPCFARRGAPNARSPRLPIVSHPPAPPA